MNEDNHIIDNDVKPFPDTLEFVPDVSITKDFKEEGGAPDSKKPTDLKGQLEQVMTSLHDALVAERRKKEPYKDLFKTGTTFGGLLYSLEERMSKLVLDACDIIEVKHNIRVNDEQYDALLALPYLMKEAERDIEKNESHVCCVDKAHRMVAEWFESLGEEAKSE